jgi:hypothetical protein
MTAVATSANLNNIQETNILVSSINKDNTKEENFDELDDELVYITDNEVEDKLLNSSQMKRYWVTFFFDMNLII